MRALGSAAGFALLLFLLLVLISHQRERCEAGGGTLQFATREWVCVGPDGRVNRWL